MNISGLIKGKDVAVDGGKGAAIVTGKIDASDTSAGATGGKVTVTGDKVALIGATVDASGAAGGGTVLVGGDLHGGGTTPTASGTLVTSTSTIRADATDNGNGGKVVVWSDKVTAYSGKISAKGGPNGGDGGFVEVSGKDHLIYKGQVDVTAAKGTAGQLLLDPASITIDTAGNEDIDGNGTTGDDITTVADLDDALLDQPGAASVISNTAVEGLLTAGTTLTLAATNHISVNAAVAPTAGNTGSLTLDAPTVNLNAKITLQGAGVLAGGAGTTTVNVGSSGSIQNGVDVVASGGAVHVAAGTFAENVSVGKSISLLGAQNGVDARGRAAAESVINGQVTLTAPNTTLDGFKIQQSTAGAGVVALNAQGDQIVNNIITDNVFGLQLASDGSTQVLIKNNAFDTNARPGSASGNGIYTDFTVSNVKVEANSFTGDTEGSVSFFGSAGNPQSNVQIVDNTMTDDGPISLETITNVTITGNTINNSGTHAIWIAGGVSNVTISNNFLENNGGAGVKFASVNIDPTPASNVTITNNAIDGNADGGIVINSGRYSGTLNATSNFWGSANGPQDGANTFNVGAQGDAIVNPGGVTVNYVRWLTSGADQNVGTAGFQPDAGSLFAPVTVNGLFFSNIQAAHNAASAGDTISLASGTFTEAVTTTKNLELQFTGDGALANSTGSLTLGANLTISGNGSLSIAEDVSAGNHTFIVDTQTGGGTFINITGPISSTGGNVQILGQQTVTIGASISNPATLTLSSLDNVVVNAAMSAQNLISVTAGLDGTGGFTIGAGGSLQTTAAGGDISISTGTTSGNIALGGSVTSADEIAISTAGSVTQTAGSITATNLDISGATSVNLPTTTNSITGAITVAASSNVTLFNNNATNLGSSTVGGNLSVTSTGVIGDSGALTVTGSATFETRSGGTADIVLDQPLSTFGSITARSRNAANSANGTGNISIVESGTMDVTQVATLSGSINLEATKINLGAANTVESSGTITLQPTLASANINLGTDVPGGFSFTSAQLAALKDGFSAIVIGRSGGTGIVTVSSNVTFTDPLSVVGGSFLGGARLTTNGTNNLTLQARTGGIATLGTPLDVSVGGTLTVSSAGAGAAGDIFITSSSPLAVGAITTDAGSAQTVNIRGNGVTLTAGNAGAANDNYTFTSTDVFVVNNGVNFTGNTMSVTASGNITDGGSGVLGTTGAGGLTLISSTGGIGVNVANPLGVSVGGTGVLTMGLLGTPVTGNVFVTSAGALTLGAVNTGGAVQTIDVRTTAGGNLKLNNSVVGNDNWVLNAAGTLNNNGTTLTAASVDADAAGGIGTVAPFAVGTASISADSTGGLVSVTNTSAAPVSIGSLSAGGAGDVDYSQSGGGSAAFGAVSSANGSVTLINSGAGITLNGNVSAGATGDVSVTSSTLGDITVNSPVSGVNVTLDSAGNLTTNAAVTAGDQAILSANGFILTTALVSGTSVNATAGGNATINGNVTATAAVSIDSGAAASIGGNVSGGSIGVTSVLNTTANGDITATGTAGISSGGNITGTGTVSGSAVNLIAVSGIGTIGTPLDVSAGTLTASTSGLGAASIFLSNSGGGTMTLSDVSTVGVNADITVSQSGAGNRLRLVNVSAANGNVTLSTSETINEALNDDSGAHTAEISGNNATLIANNGIGTTSRLDLTVPGTVTVNTVGGDVNIANSVGLTLGASSVGGDLTAVAESGNFATTGAVIIGGAGTLTAQAGGATMNIGDTLTGGTGNLTLTADGGITLTNTVDGGNTFSATAAHGNIIALGDIGSNTAPTAVNFNGVDITLQNVRSGAGNQAYTASGLITLNGNVYRSLGGAISFNGNAVLAASPMAVTSGGGSGDNITFAGTVNGSTALTLDAGTGTGAGNVIIGGAAGGSSPLTSINAKGNNITVHDVTTSGPQIYTGAGTITLSGNYSNIAGAITFTGNATLASAVTVSANGGTDTDDILFSGTVNGPGSLTASAAGAGDVTITGAGGGSSALGFANITGNDISLNGMITGGAQSYVGSGNVSLNSGTYTSGGAITASAGGNLTLNGTFSSAADQTYTGPGGLSLAGTYSASSGAITFTAPTATLTGTTSVSTTGGTDTDDIHFTGAITGANSLTLSAAGAGDVALDGNITIGSINAIGNDIALQNATTSTGQTYTASGTISLGGTNYINTTGNVTFAGDALLSGDTTVTTTGNVSFGGTLNGPHALAVNTTSGGGITTFTGAVGGSAPLTSITTDADGTTRINGGAVHTSLNQTFNDKVTVGIAPASFTGNDITFNDAVTLGANTTVTGNDIKFAGTINSSGGDRDLTVNAAGAATFDGQIGSSNVLKNLTVSAPTGIALNGGVVSTSEDQTYNDDVTLGANTTLASHNVLFVKKVDSKPANTFGLTVNSSGGGTTTFTGPVGSVNALGFLTTDATTADGTTAINGGSVKTIGDQTFNDAVTLGANTILDGNDISLNGAVDGAQTLTVNSNTSGITTFGGPVGASTALVSVVTNSDGETHIDGGSVRTSGAQTYGDIVKLGADAILTGTNITFSLTLDGAHKLTVNASGDTTFAGAVGGSTPLTSLTTDAAGNTRINGGAVSTSGDQDYNDKVTLNNNTDITGGTINFHDTLDSFDSTARNLTVTGSGTTTFGGIVGGAHPLQNLTTDAVGVTAINTTAITTTADQIYHDAVTLGADATLDGVNITFDSTINGAQSLTVNSNGGSGVTIFGGAIGGTTALTNLTTNQDGVTKINGGLVKTTANQTYNDDVTLGVDTTLNGLDIKFTHALDSATATPVNLTVDTNTASIGKTIFAGPVGVTNPLKNLTTDSDGSTQINGGVVNTTEDQTYNDPVSLGADPLTTLSGNDITFASTLNADVASATRNLVINTSGGGVTTFGGLVGNVTNSALTSITTNPDGTTRINTTSIKTTGDQAYNDTVLLGSDLTIDGNDITFGKTVDSATTTPQDLTVNSSGTGNTVFTGAVGATNALDNLTTNADGKTFIKGGSVKTNLDQTYNDAVVISADTTLTTRGAKLASTLDSDTGGPFNLDVNTSSSSNTEFDGIIGGTSPLKKLTTNADGKTLLNTTGITTTDDQTYNDAVLVGGNPVLNGKNITFASTVDGGTGSLRALTVNSNAVGGATTTFLGAIGGTTPLLSLTTNADGKTIFGNGTVKTTGNQAFGDDVQINQDTTFTASGTTLTSISFAKTINSNVTSGTTGPKLIINSGVTGTTTLVGNSDITVTGAIGDASNILTVTMMGKNISVHDTATLGDQLYTPSGVGTINGHFVSDSGKFNMAGNAAVGGLSTVTTTSQPITFAGTIDGNHSLTLNAGNGGVVTVSKAVGGTTPLGGFAVDNAKTIDLVSVKTKKTGADDDHNGDISLNVIPNTTTENHDDNKGVNTTAFIPVGTIKLDSGLQSNGGDVFLGATGSGRADNEVLATPSIIIEPPNKGTATISGANVTMAKNEKLAVNGSVNITADDTVKIGDITADDSISVNAPHIKIVQRQPGTVFSDTNGTLLHDLNTDFVARNRIDFNSGDVQLDTPATSNRVLFATTTGAVTGSPSGTSVRLLDDKHFSIFRAGGNGEIIDLRADGPSITNPAAALAGAAPQESRQPEVENTVASSQAAELRNLGIFARDLDRSSLIGFLEGIVLYNDVPGRIASGEQLPREQYQVTKNRLSQDGAQRVLDMYYQTFFQTDEYGRPITKNGKKVDNISAINNAIEKAIEAYRGKTGQKTGSIDPVAFREYVETTPSQGEALKHMNKLRTLFNEILPVGQASSNKGLGLTPREAAISRKVLVESLGVQGMEPDKLEAAILANTGRAAPVQAVPKPAPKPVMNPTPQPAPKPVVNQPAPKPADSTAKPVANPTVNPAPKATVPPKKAEPRPTFNPEPKIDPGK